MIPMRRAFRSPALAVHSLWAAIVGAARGAMREAKEANAARPYLPDGGRPSIRETVSHPVFSPILYTKRRFPGSPPALPPSLVLPEGEPPSHTPIGAYISSTSEMIHLQSSTLQCRRGRRKMTALLVCLSKKKFFQDNRSRSVFDMFTGKSHERGKKLPAQIHLFQAIDTLIHRHLSRQVRDLWRIIRCQSTSLGPMKTSGGIWRNWRAFLHSRWPRRKPVWSRLRLTRVPKRQSAPDRLSP